MKILAISDIHLTNKNRNFPVMEDGFSALLHSQRKALESFCSDIYRLKPDLVVIAGDVVDRNTLDPYELSVLNQFIISLNTACDEVGAVAIVLSGNHGYYDKNGEITPIGAMTSVMNSQVFPGTSFEVLDFGHYEVLVVPYHSDYRKLEEMIARENELNKEEDKVPRILIGHWPTANAVLDNGITSGKGVNLTQDIIDSFDICLLGDFHRHQRLIGTQNAYYIGAPFDLKFGEHYQRSWLEVDIGDDGFDIKHIYNRHQIPLKKLTFEEAISQNHGNSIVRVEGIEREEQIEQLSKVHAYDVQYRRKRVIKEVREDVHMINVTSSQSDKELIMSHLEDMESTERIAIAGRIFKLAGIK